jgi:SPP1 family predicted phage head-tail adaptor
MSIEAGRLRHRVRIEQLENLLDSNGAVIQDEETGQVAQEWAEVATVWAAIEPLSAREFIQSQATQSQITARIIIRFRDGLNAAMRLVHVRRDMADVIYNPHGFLADKESGLEYLTIPVSTGVSEAGL